MSAYNKFHLKGLRQNAIDYTYELIRMEDENTGYQGQAPVNKAMNMMLVLYVSTEFPLY